MLSREKLDASDTGRAIRALSRIIDEGTCSPGESRALRKLRDALGYCEGKHTGNNDFIHIVHASEVEGSRPPR